MECEGRRHSRLTGQNLVSHKSLGEVDFLDLGGKNSQIQQPVDIPACIGGSEPLNQAALKGGGGRGAAPPHGAEPGQASGCRPWRSRKVWRYCATQTGMSGRGLPMMYSHNILAIKRNS